VTCHNGQITVELIVWDGQPTFVVGTVRNSKPCFEEPSTENKTVPFFMNINQYFVGDALSIFIICHGLP